MPFAGCTAKGGSLRLQVSCPWVDSTRRAGYWSPVKSSRALQAKVAAAALEPRMGMAVARTGWGGNGLHCEIAPAAAGVRRVASS